MLFTSAGMQPLIPYFSGAPHPSGRRLVNVQRCLRTVDIDEVGDDSHLTCFEMLGNWSLGDYYKHESLSWTLEWLLKIGLPFERLGVTVYTEDDYARGIWRQLGVPDERVRVFGREENWWGPPGPHGPCGPDSEIFYIHDDGRWLELGNNVFIVHEQGVDGSLRALPQHNVDVGLGLERIACLLQGVDSVYETDLFRDTLRTVRELSDDARHARGADRLRPRALLGAARARRRPALQQRARLRPAPAAAARDPPGAHARHRRPVPAERGADRARRPASCSTCSRARSAASRGRCAAG